MAWVLDFRSAGPSSKRTKAESRSNRIPMAAPFFALLFGRWPSRTQTTMPDNQTIHIVDDDDAARQSLEFLLKSHKFAVRAYESAVAFLAALPNLNPGCVITDVRMPEMSGIELLKRLKSIANPVSVIVITGHGDVPLAVEAMKIRRGRVFGEAVRRRIVARRRSVNPRSLRKRWQTRIRTRRNRREACHAFDQGAPSARGLGSGKAEQGDRL